WRLLGMGLVLLLGTLSFSVVGPAYATPPKPNPVPNPLGPGKQGPGLPPLPHTPYQPGDVFVSWGNGHVLRYFQDGTMLDDLYNTIDSLEVGGTCFDATGHLYAANFTSGVMSKFDNSGNLTDPIWGGPFSILPESCS